MYHSTPLSIHAAATNPHGLVAARLAAEATYQHVRRRGMPHFARYRKKFQAVVLLQGVRKIFDTA